MPDLPRRVDEGVRRAKAASLLGHETIRAFHLLPGGATRELDVPLAGLLSRKAIIDRSAPVDRAKWDGIYRGMRRDPTALPRIAVVRASRGTPIEDVRLFPSLTLLPPPP